MKTVTFHKPVNLTEGGFDTDVPRYRFKYSVVETALIGSPEEKSETRSYSIKVGISWELRVNWRLSNAPENDLVKVLYEFGKRHITQNLQKGDLLDDEELVLTTQNAPDECPFEVSRIDEPQGATFEVNIEAPHTAQGLSGATSQSNTISYPDRRKQRSRFALTRLYELAHGSRSQPVALESVAQAEGWSRQETSEVCASLVKDSLIKHFAIGGLFVLTHQGIVEAESALETEAVKKRRADRARVLEKVYSQTLQQGPTQIDLEPLAEAEGINGQDLSNIYEFLTGAGFVRAHGAGYYIIMLPQDQLRVEEVMSSSHLIEVFFCYSHEDEKLRDELEKHLRMMQRQGTIAAWHDRKIGAGTEWEGQISEHLNRARVILLLVSVDFINSEYCWNIEIDRAMAKHEAGTARVIPIILRACDWHDAPFGKLQALPTDARPVVDPRWHNIDSAFLDVVKGIKKAVQELRSDLT